jgi:4-amino-4-deoxy-L-arabinose transferase-like glycosyltransferase
MNITYFFKKLKPVDFFIILVFILAIVTKLPSWEYPISGDSNHYAELTENLATNFTYSSPISSGSHMPHGKYPFLFPLFSVPFFFIFKSAVYAIKASSIFWSALTVLVVYLFSRYLKLNNLDSFLVSALVLFNPWFFYFNGILPLSESLANFLLILGIFIYFLKRSSASYLLTGFVFGLAIITRFTSGFFIFLFIVFSLYNIFKRKKLIENIYFIIAASLPVCLWLLRNIVIFRGLFPKGSGYSEALSFWAKIPYMFVIYSIAVALTFSFLLPFILRGAIRAWRKRDTFWLLVTASCIIFIFAHIALNYNPSSIFQVIISRTRYLTPLVPILTIFAFLDFKRMRIKSKKIKTGLVVFLLFAFIFLSAALSYGSFKDSIDKVIPLPAIYSQRSEHRAQAIDWANENIPLNSKVSILFMEGEAGMTILGYFVKEQLDDKLIYVNWQNQRPDFIISDLPAERITEITSLQPNEIYRTRNRPFSYVYKTD